MLPVMQDRSSKLRLVPNPGAKPSPTTASKRRAPMAEDENQSEDDDQVAARVMATFLANADFEAAPAQKNPVAVALGELRGANSGPARAAKLSPKKRAAIAKKAAAARWGAKKV
jgi:hypothetical protein